MPRRWMRISSRPIAAKPKLVQISTAYGQQQEGSAIIPRNKYVEIRQEKPKTKEEANRPEFKTCKYTTEAIVSDGIDKGRNPEGLHRADLPGASPEEAASRARSSGKPSRRSAAARKRVAQATGLRILAAIVAAVPVRLMKRDLLFVVERLASLLDERRLAIVARQHGIKKAKDSDSIGKLFAAYLRKSRGKRARRLAGRDHHSSRPCTHRPNR